MYSKGLITRDQIRWHKVNLLSSGTLWQRTKISYQRKCLQLNRVLRPPPLPKDQTGSPNSRFTDQRPRSKPLHDKDIILLQLQSYKKIKIAAITYNSQIVQLLRVLFSGGIYQIWIMANWSYKILSYKPSDHSFLFPKPRPKILSTPLPMWHAL